MLHFVQHDKPGRSLVIVNGTAVTEHQMWLLPSPYPSPWTETVYFLDLGVRAAKQLSIGVHGFAENRENRQSLARERDRKWVRRRNKKGNFRKIFKTPKVTVSADRCGKSAISFTINFYLATLATLPGFFGKESCYLCDYIANLCFGDFGKDWKRERAGSELLGYRKIAAHVLKIRIRREQVNRYRIMNTRLDTGFLEMETEGVAMCAFDYKQVVDVIRTGGGRLNRHVSNSREEFAVECGPFLTLCVPSGPDRAILRSGRPPEGCPALH